jgi:TonB family protein
MVCTRRLIAFTVFALCLVQLPRALSQLPIAQDPSWQRYQSLLQVADLETKPSEPFLIKLDYQLYDLDGNATSKGTVEKVWGQTANAHTTIRSSTLQMDDSESPDKVLLHHTRENYLVHEVLNAFVRPMPFSKRRLDFILGRKRQTVQGVDLACLSIGRAGQEQPRTQLFCTDVDMQLQAITGEGPLLIERSNFVAYRDKKVPSDVTITYRDKIAIKAHVTELTALKPSDTPYVPNVTDVPIVDGQVLSRANPSFPIGAKLSHSSGLVILTALITKDGKVSGLDVVSSPSSTLSKSAMEAAKKWTYTPYKRDGQPTEAEETITVDFSFTSNP